MVVGSIISIIFIYYCDENKRNKAKLSVCWVVDQKEKLEYTEVDYEIRWIWIIC